MGNCYSLYSKNLGMSGKMVWWSTEPNWSTKLGDLTECLKLTLLLVPVRHLERRAQVTYKLPAPPQKTSVVSIIFTRFSFSF